MQHLCRDEGSGCAAQAVVCLPSDDVGVMQPEGENMTTWFDLTALKCNCITSRPIAAQIFDTFYSPP